MEKLFNPQKVAVVGVSPAEDNLGRFIMWNLINFSFSGEIVPFGRKEGYVFGHRIRTLEEIPEDLDVACILVPAPKVPETIRLFHEKATVKRFVVYTGGFSEYGEQGEAFEREIRNYAAQNNILLVGPNCLGIMNVKNGFVIPFVKLNHQLIKRGNVAIIAQSGGVALSHLNLISEEGIGSSITVSIGNKMVLNEVHYLNYLAQDPDTKVILLYLESIANGRKFYEALKSCPKPVIVHKANITEASRKIAKFHTASLAVKDELLTAAIKQAGKLRVYSIDEALLALKACELPPLKGNKIAILSRSGGEGVILADAAGLNGFALPEYPEEITNFVKTRSRAKVIRPTNPLDLGDLFDIPAYWEVTEKIAQLDMYHGIVFSSQFFHEEWVYVPKLLTKLREISETYQKPIAVYVGGEKRDLIETKSQGIIPIFNSPEAVVKALKISLMLNR
ncbi:CoA-binding domain-containing protein [Thermosulfidibacter takaii ABI70S6]|uniref:CoA-binding domain-containing protein n=1 Tax=Thermosulfidibacter takaii (strain DSM 17441 / JCM 13301 / NBRC 103674 / ABI70S6) TaxID=1298851 RepID=A0A0S3QU72_THET7|nr:CoA-binding protein [Thermosulfidibacter takaii]BAT71885.1 CoA-binding domain-containing protein [Thermosulfidibacter takaii ABI70S6]